MRLIQIIIPEGKRETITGLLEKRGIDYALSPETSSREYSDVLFFPIPKEGVEDIIDELRSSGLEKDGYTVVTRAEAVVAKRFEELKEKYKEAEEVDESRVAREELKAQAEVVLPSTRIYLTFTIVAAVIATAGLLLDSPAIVVGSMVIAPLIGPAMASCVGTVVDDHELFQSGIIKQIIGLLSAIVGSAIFARLALSLFVSPNLELLQLGQVVERIHPGFLSLAVALGSGVAGALSMTAGINTALVGVMISVALIPPTATVGLGMATLNLKIVAGAGILLLVNVISINLAGTFTLWYEGYKPGRWYQEKGAKRVTKRRAAILTTFLLILTAFLGFITWNVYTNARFESEAQAIVKEIVALNEGEVISFNSSYSGLLLRRINSIRATISESGANPGISDQIKDRIKEQTGKYVAIFLSFVKTQQSSQG